MGNKLRLSALAIIASMALVAGFAAQAASTATVTFDGPFVMDPTSSGCLSANGIINPMLGADPTPVCNRVYGMGESYTISGSAVGSGVTRVQLDFFDVFWGLEGLLGPTDNPVLTVNATCASCGSTATSVTFTYTDTTLAPGYYGVVARAFDSGGYGYAARLQTYKTI